MLYFGQLESSDAGVDCILNHHVYLREGRSKASTYSILIF